MSADPMTSLLKMRRMAVDDARARLGACLRAEDAAAAKAAEARNAVQRETENAANPSLGDMAVEAFAAWLPRGRAAVSAAERLREEAEADTARARSDLMLARAAAEAAEELVRQRRAEQALAAMRREQASLDEIAGRRRPR